MSTTTTLTDGTNTITVVSDDPLHIHHPTYQAFLAAFEDVNSLLFVDTLDINPFNNHEFHYVLVLQDGRILDQDLKQGNPWQIRPNDSGYFTLPELLLNNTLRSTSQDLIDQLKVTSISATVV